MLRRRSSSSLFGVLLAMTVAAAAGGASAADPPKPAKQAPAKRKPAKASKTRAPLTAESLGLTETSLSAIKAADATPPAAASPPAPAASPPAPPAVTKDRPAATKDRPAATKDRPAATRDRDRVSDLPRETRRRMTLAVNPLPMIAGRYGMDLELVPAAHHAIVSSAWLQTFPTAVLERFLPSGIDAGGAQARLGGELGYRLYSGSGGAEGLFVGGSGVLMPLALPRLRSDLHPEVVSFDAYGGALDIGAQVITSSGLTIGGGLGAMALAYTPPASAPLPAGAPKVTVELPHVLPRLLFATGWSF